MREQANFADIQVALEAFRENLSRRLAQHGNEMFCSTHEGLGIITEEQHELISAVHSNDVEQFRSECLDVAVAAFWAYLSTPSSLSSQNQGD